MDRKKKPHLIVVSSDEDVIVPQLVPVTIAWVEADRAYRVTYMVTLSLLFVALILTWVEMDPRIIIRALMAGALVQTLGRAYHRHLTRKELDEMRTRIGL